MADSRSFPVWRALTVSALCLLAVGCRVFRTECNAPAAYQSAQTGAALKIPPGLQTPDTSQALKIPPLDAPVPPPRTGKDDCLDAPPPFATPKAAPQPAA